MHTSQKAKSTKHELLENKRRSSCVQFSLLICIRAGRYALDANNKNLASGNALLTNLKHLKILKWNYVQCVCSRPCVFNSSEYKWQICINKSIWDYSVGRGSRTKLITRSFGGTRVFRARFQAELLFSSKTSVGKNNKRLGLKFFGDDVLW